MTIRAVPGIIVATALSASALLVTPGTSASAEPCPDIEIVYARGTAEPDGVGQVGDSFVAALRARLPAKSVAVYPVNYPANNLFGDRTEFTASVIDGIRDAVARVQATSVNCPNTRIVLGGYSQGAAIAGFVTSAAVPDGVPVDQAPAPLPPEVADHVAAVTLFGMPSATWMENFGAPPVVIGPLYADKTINLCSPGDAICDGTPSGMPGLAHLLYGVNGMVDDAAAFAAGRV